MPIVKIDATNPDNFRQKKLIEPGQYVFTIANSPVVESAASSGKPIVKVELRCDDDGDFKGCPIYETITITPKAQWKLCHLALAAGAQTREEIENEGVELSLLQNCRVDAVVEIEKGGIDTATGKNYRDKNRVEKYLFEEEPATA
jgi:hypothetical protein